MAFKLILLLAGLLALPCQAELRDPTQPAYQLPKTMAKVDSDIELVVSAIFISARSRHATINGISVKQGQSVVIESLSKPDFDQASTENTNIASNITLPVTSITPSATVADQPYSNIVKIIGIHKNSVTVEQNQKFMTLPLVHRSYK